MKNIVKVLRFKDNKVRLYEVPTCVVLERGEVVEVEYGADSETAFGVTVSASYCGDFEERMIRDLFNVLPGMAFKRVVAVHERQTLTWVDSSANEDTAQDAAQEELLTAGA